MQGSEVRKRRPRLPLRPLPCQLPPLAPGQSHLANLALLRVRLSQASTDCRGPLVIQFSSLEVLEKVVSLKSFVKQQYSVPPPFMIKRGSL